MNVFMQVIKMILFSSSLRDTDSTGLQLFDINRSKIFKANFASENLC